MENLPQKQTTGGLMLSQSHNDLLIQLESKTILSSQDKDCAIALLSPSIFNFPPNGLKKNMMLLIGKTHINCGYKMNESEILLSIDELCDDLKKQFKTITFPEIEIAFKNGWQIQQKEFFGLNNKTYMEWVNTYLEGENRLRIKKLLLSAKEKANVQPLQKSEVEIEEIMKCGILKSFEDFKKGAVILDAGNVKYNYLEKAGLINFSKERKLEVLAKTKERLKFEATERRQITETISQAVSKILPETEISEAKKDCLKLFYYELKKNNFEISDLL